MRTFVRALLCISLVPAAAVDAAAPSKGDRPTGYSSKPIRIILPLSAGGSADSSARTTADALAEGFGHPVVVDNRPGANGILVQTLFGDARDTDHRGSRRPGLRRGRLVRAPRAACDAAGGRGARIHDACPGARNASAAGEAARTRCRTSRRCARDPSRSDGEGVGAMGEGDSRSGHPGALNAAIVRSSRNDRRRKQLLDSSPTS